MSEEHLVTFNIELNTQQGLSNLRQFETLMFRAMGVLRRLTGNETIDAALSKIQKFIMTVRLAHSAAIALQAASGPIGWGLAIVGVSTAIISASDFAMGE